MIEFIPLPHELDALKRVAVKAGLSSEAVALATIAAILERSLIADHAVPEEEAEEAVPDEVIVRNVVGEEYGSQDLDKAIENYTNKETEANARI